MICNTCFITKFLEPSPGIPELSEIRGMKTQTHLSLPSSGSASAFKLSFNLYNSKIHSHCHCLQESIAQFCDINNWYKKVNWITNNSRGLKGQCHKIFNKFCKWKNLTLGGWPHMNRQKCFWEDICEKRVYTQSSTMLTWCPHSQQPP